MTPLDQLRLRLPAHEFDRVMEATKPVAEPDRDALLKDIAAELGQHEVVGPGLRLPRADFRASPASKTRSGLPWVRAQSTNFAPQPKLTTCVRLTQAILNCEIRWTVVLRLEGGVRRRVSPLIPPTT